MKTIFLSLIMAVCSISLFAQNKIKLFNDKKQSTITYAMKHPLHSWTGVSNDVAAVLLTNDSKTEFYQVAVAVKIASFDTKNANRDSHTMEVTEALKYPTITFSSTSIKVNENKATITGNLTFHGVTQPITVEATQQNVNGKMAVTGKFNVSMTQFRIDPPSLVGLATKDNIDLEFKIVF